MVELGGIVRGPKGTYRVEVVERHRRRGEVWTEARYYVHVYDNATGENLHTRPLTIDAQNTQMRLREMVDEIKAAAARDAFAR